MKSFRILLVLPLLFTAGLTSCVQYSDHATSETHGYVGGASGSEPVRIPHGITAL